MTEFDVITLEDAKDHLVVDFGDDDRSIERLIKTAIAWVETYTNVYLWQRAKVVYTTAWQTDIPDFPVTVGTVKNSADETIDVTVKKGATRIYVCCPAQSTINLTVGYDDVEKIPAPLIEACYKLITYLYENKDAYTAGLPLDIQVMINQYRRTIL